MKKISFLLIVTAIVASCGDKSSSGTTSTAASDSTKTELAYTTEKPVEWEWGTKENIQIAMKALKAFEQGNMDESLTYFADSVMLEFDGYEEFVARDSAAVVLKNARAMYKTITVKMNDYESVKSKDGKTEYVSLWYKQIWEDKDGKVDSSECMNDIQLKNGKITLLNEKTRRYGVK